jgi:hypothetical protein
MIRCCPGGGICKVCELAAVARWLGQLKEQERPRPSRHIQVFLGCLLNVKIIGGFANCIFPSFCVSNFMILTYDNRNKFRAHTVDSVFQHMHYGTSLPALPHL